jgi:hypothetical protein
MGIRRKHARQGRERIYRTGELFFDGIEPMILLGGGRRL